MALNPPDRSADRTQNFKHSSDKKATWDDLDGHPSASHKSDGFQNTWMNGPAHQAYYEHFVNHPDFQGVLKQHKYNRTYSSTEKGVKGIVGIKNNGATFIPDSDITSYHWQEREGSPDSSTREDNYRKSRQASGYDD